MFRLYAQASDSATDHAFPGPGCASRLWVLSIHHHAHTEGAKCLINKKEANTKEWQSVYLYQASHWKVIKICHQNIAHCIIFMVNKERPEMHWQVMI